MKQCKVIALMLLALALLAGCSSPDPIDLEEPIEQVPTAAELQASLEDGGSTREVTLYYKDLMATSSPSTVRSPGRRASPRRRSSRWSPPKKTTCRPRAWGC